MIARSIGSGVFTQAWRQMTAASTLHCKGIRNFAAPAKQKSKAALKSPIDALQIIKTSAKCKFDESVDVALHLNVDPRKSDQAMRGLAVLPHGTGKKLKVAVFATGPAAEEAIAAGATHVGGEDLVEKIKGGMLDFDRCLATPAAMPLATKVARVLGPRGLMPNAKLGTVTDRVGDTIRRLTSGVPFKTDKAGNVHAAVGKVSFSSEALTANTVALVQAVLASRPKGVKDPFILSAHMSSTMGPAVPILPATLLGVGEGGDPAAAAAAAMAAAAAARGGWVWTEPVEPQGDVYKIPSKKLRRYLLAKRGLDPHSEGPPAPAA